MTVFVGQLVVYTACEPFRVFPSVAKEDLRLAKLRVRPRFPAYPAPELPSGHAPRLAPRPPAWPCSAPTIAFAITTKIAAATTVISQRIPSRYPGVLDRQHRFPVRRRAADGRGHASADAHGRRPLRQGAAEPERRAAARPHARGSTASRAASRSSASASRTAMPPNDAGPCRRRTSTASTPT